MAALLLFTCLRATGLECDYHVVSVEVPRLTCPIAALQQAAVYTNQHPNRIVKRVVCTDPRKVGFYLHRYGA